MEIVDYSSALSYLFGRLNYERTPAPRSSLRLDRMRQLLARLGNPLPHWPVIHIAGTKGKGSVAALLAAALSAAGYRTALYTSPHLSRLEERMQIDGQRCTEQQLVELTQQAQAAAEPMDQAGEAPTFFELTTAISLLHFAQQRADLVVLETGLGGRLDSTNVCHPLVSVITSISYDHTRQLGSTLDRIAAEKCGIIKPGRPVISGVLDKSPRDVVRRTAQDRGCELRELGRDFDVEQVRLDRQSLETRLRYRPASGPAVEVALALLGRHQARNAALALATLDELAALGWPSEQQAASRSLAATRCPARIEVLRRSPDVVLDVAHNVASAAALADVLDECFLPHQSDGSARLVFATSGDKDPAGMLQLLLPRFQHVLLTQFPSNPRTLPPAELLRIARPLLPAGGAELTVFDAPQRAWRAAMSAAGPGDLVCVAGSFFLAAELRDAMLRDCAALGASVV